MHNFAFQHFLKSENIFKWVKYWSKQIMMNTGYYSAIPMTEESKFTELGALPLTLIQRLRVSVLEGDRWEVLVSCSLP